MATVLSDVLREEHVTLELQAGTREEALREIIATMRGETKLADPEKFLSEVLAREKEQSTYMGNGVAFPHARTDLVNEIIFGAGRSQDGVVFTSEEERVNLLFVIAVPRRMVNDYLVCIGALARVVNDAETRAALRSCATAAEFIELIREASRLLE